MPKFETESQEADWWASRAGRDYVKQNKFGLASLANLDRLPPKGAILVTPPRKIVNGSGSPCRVLALVSVT